MYYNSINHNRKNNISNLIHKKRIEGEKNDDKDGKALYKLMNNAVYDKTMGKLEK